MPTSREERIENYSAKVASGPKCSECNATQGLLVVQTKDRLGVRCILHVDGLKVRKGQWKEREAAERKKASES